MGKLKSRKWQIIIALILVVVILLVSAVGSIISLIMAILDTEQKDEAGLYTETRLYVRALQGKWDSNQKHSYNSDDKKDVPIDELKVTLTPDKGVTTDSKKKTVTDERSTIDFDPTDKKGLSYIVLDSQGMGQLTMSTGNDAYYGISAASGGKPTKHYKVLAQGRFTYYDSYTYKEASDTKGTNYNLNNSKPSSAHFSDTSPLSKQKDSPSDTWHVFGLMKTPQPISWDKTLYNKLKRQRKTNPALLYAWSPQGASYGAGIGIDTGYGTSYGLIADLFVPYNKYFGKYGLNPKHGPEDGGGKRDMNASTTIDPYLKSIGAPGARQVWDKVSNNNTLYYLDDSEDIVNGQTRSQYLHRCTLGNKAWPTSMTGGKVVQDAERKDGSANTMYTIKSMLTEIGKQKWGNKFENHFSDSTPQDLAKIETHDKADPYIFQCGIGVKDRQWVLQFWTETVTVGDDDGSDLAGATNYLSWAKLLSDKQSVGYILGANHGSSFHIGDVDCSSLVFWSLKNNGYLPKEKTCFSTSNEIPALTRNGFKQVSMDKLKPGDILWKSGHTEIYTGGKSYSLGAHQNLDGHRGKGHGKGHKNSTAQTEVGFALGKQHFSKAFRYSGNSNSNKNK